jgi:hypothetical protein
MGGMEVASHRPDYRWSALGQVMPVSGDPVSGTAEQWCFWAGMNDAKVPS